MRYISLISCLLLLAFGAIAQPASFDKLTLKKVPANLSRQSTNQQLTLSNYQVSGAVPFAVLFQKGSSFTAKPELAFAAEWRRYMHLADTAATPKAKRGYTLAGVQYFSGGAEINGPEGQGYYLLTVYLPAGWAQSIVIKTTTAKDFKNQLFEWGEKLQEIEILNK